MYSHELNKYPISNNHSNLNSSNYNSAIPSHIIEERQDVIFRKVRGILNKITPETFDKLSKELVNVGLNSPRTLRGVIYLLFDKALKDLKYSSLYAKLCQELSERAPNFEQDHGPNTFCKFLISKCEDEFERRRKATEDFDSKNVLTDEEFELRAIAKQKMLGNIKFICELGKKRLLQEEILHECIRGLLSKKKERSIQDQAQDLECLCQIMRTIGSLLDIQASRNLMNQYFERIDMISKKPELPSRIRFMLRDVIDLRNNNWRPRPFQREDNVPQTLSKLREEAGFDPAAASALEGKFGNNKNLIGISDLSKLHGNKLSMLFDDEPSFTTSTDFHWGSFLPIDQSFDAFSSNIPVTRQNSTNSNVNNSSSTVQKSTMHPIDPIFEPGAARFDHQPFSNSGNVAKHGHDGRKFADGFGFEVRPFSDPGAMNARNDREPPISTNPKNKTANNGPQSRAQQREEVPYNNSQRRFVEPRQPPTGFRGGNASPPVQPPPPRRNPRDAPPQPPAHQNYRSDSRNMHSEVPDARERRFQRPGHVEHEHRQPRFSNNNNYRQNRNERPPINREHIQYEKSNLESELNFNWRAGPNVSNAAPANNTALNSSSSNPAQKSSGPRSNDQNIESKTGPLNEPRLLNKNNVVQSKTAISQSGDTNRKLEDTFGEKRPSLEKIPPPLNNDIELSAPPVNSTNLKTVPPPMADSPNRFSDARQSQNARHNSSSSRPAPRRPPPNENNNNNPQANNSAPHQNFRHGPRNNQGESSDRRDDRRDQRKFHPSNSQDQEHQQSRFPDNGVAHQQDRNYRHPIGRNQQFENSPAPESDKIPNWRKGIANIVAPNNVPKEQPVQNPNPLLPKPPSRISDTNFSLRPSHNLIGRVTGTVKPSQPPTKPSTNAIDSLSKDSLQTRNSNQELEDSSGMKAIIKPVGKLQAETFQALPHPNALPPVKVCTDMTAENDNGSSGSPTRAAARDFHVNKFISILSELSSGPPLNVNRIAAKIRELKIPKSYQHNCLVSAMKQTILKSENDRDNIGKLFVQLIPSAFESSSLMNAFKVIFEQMHVLEVETPKVKSLVAGLLSRAILDGLLNLEELGNILSGGKHHPLFLLVLQKLEKSGGQAWLNEKFVASKINLMDMLPEVDRSKDRLANILKDRCLGFLDPMLTIEPDLWCQMKERDPAPAAVYRWIKENVDQSIQSTSMFAHVLMTCLLKYIHNLAAEKSKATAAEQRIETEASQSNKSSPSSSSQSTSDVENELLTKYQQVLQAMLKDKHMQLATLYALQSFYHGLDFPKGSLLRWFHMLYDMNIVDDDVFFIWKEEINDEFPGKGQALFQVNTWLNWLAEAESEEEEDV